MTPTPTQMSTLATLYHDNSFTEIHPDELKRTTKYPKELLTVERLKQLSTVKSRYLEVDGTIFYKFKLPEVQINLDL